MNNGNTLLKLNLFSPLYADDLHSKERNDDNCFWLSFDRNLSIDHDKLQRASGRQFVLKGIIDTSSQGHLGAYLATIRNIYYLEKK